jgi:hypothetical protein
MVRHHVIIILCTCLARAGLLIHMSTHVNDMGTHAIDMGTQVNDMGTYLNDIGARQRHGRKPYYKNTTWRRLFCYLLRNL